MPRLTLALLSLVVSVCAARLAWNPDTTLAQAEDAIVTPGRAQDAVTLYHQALSVDTANAYRWADLAQALSESNRPAEARPYFQRAYALAPHTPPIALRYTNFELLQNNQQEALRLAATVLDTVPDYDAILFSYFDRTIDNPAHIVDALGNQRRAMRAWLSHLINIGSPSTTLAWNRITASHFADDKLAASYVDYLLRTKSYDAAQTTWNTWLGDRRKDSNLVFNAQFKTEPLPSQLDWHLASNPDLFETTRDSEGARIAFHGQANVNYDHLFQVAILPRPGRYRLSARIKTENLTTNEGIRLAIPDIGIQSDPIVGSVPWSVVTLDFITTQPRTIRVAILRRPSGKFDNKIEGTAHVTEVTLAPASTH